MSLRAAILALMLVAAGAMPVAAERLVSAVSNTQVQVTSSFVGETLSLFGSIEPDIGAEQRWVEGPFHVVVAIEGPLTARVARRKTNNFGVWLNTDQEVFTQFPSFFQVLSSARLATITDGSTLIAENLLPAGQPRISAAQGWRDSNSFGRELVRLMEEQGFYGTDEDAVRFLSATTYQAQVALPSDVPNGPYIARTYVFKDGKVIARKSDGFTVRKIGFERFLGSSAVQYPLLYGLACVALAIFTGWIGGVVFRR